MLTRHVKKKSSGFFVMLACHFMPCCLFLQLLLYMPGDYTYTSVPCLWSFGLRLLDVVVDEIWLYRMPVLSTCMLSWCWPPSLCIHSFSPYLHSVATVIFHGFRYFPVDFTIPLFFLALLRYVAWFLIFLSSTRCLCSSFGSESALRLLLSFRHSEESRFPLRLRLLCTPSYAVGLLKMA